MGKLFLNCKEATQVCNKSQYEESSFLERFKLKLHTIFCSFCKEHTKKNHQLTNVIKQSNITCLDAKSKHGMRDNVEKELHKVLKQQ